MKGLHSFGHDPCASLTTQLLFSTGTKRAPPVETLWNYTQLGEYRSCDLFSNPHKHKAVFSWIYRPKLLRNHENNQYISFYCHLTGDTHLQLCNPSESGVSVYRDPSNEVFLGQYYRLCRLVHMSVVSYS